MKFWIYATSGNVDKYDLSKFNITKDSDDYNFIEVNSMEEILYLAKTISTKLIICDNTNTLSWQINILEENGCDGYIEIYDWYRE